MKSKGIILGTRTTRPTAKLIAEKFHAIYTEMPGIFSSNIEGILYVFRYGNSLVRISDAFASNKLLFNTVRAVRAMSHKYECRQTLLRSGVPCPRLYYRKDFSFDEYLSCEKTPPVIARPCHHFQGRNFHIATTKDEAIKFLNMGYYLQQIINKKTEYRMFMFNTKIMEANEKTQMRSNADQLVRNHKRGWKFEKRTLETISKTTRSACTLATQAVSSNWCAIDVCEDVLGNAFVLEMNSAPGLIERKIDQLHDRFFSEYPHLLVESSGLPNDAPDSDVY
jgi:glutathione synthase/RimK-type ligase-like ATP-grasp enzyme